MPATPRRARNFGGSSQHQKLMMANLAASLFAAEGIVTTEAKAKALRPIAEKLITKAKKAQDEGADARPPHPPDPGLPRRQGDDPQAGQRSRPALRPTATVATCASSSSARARATTPRWRASNSSRRPPLAPAFVSAGPHTGPRAPNAREFRVPVVTLLGTAAVGIPSRIVCDETGSCVDRSGRQRRSFSREFIEAWRPDRYRRRPISSRTIHEGSTPGTDHPVQPEIS